MVQDGNRRFRGMALKAAGCMLAFTAVFGVMKPQEVKADGMVGGMVSVTPGADWGGADADGDGTISASEAKAATSLFVSEYIDLKNFPNIETINIEGSAGYKKIDFSHNPKLKQITIYDNFEDPIITEINVSKNSNLEKLYISWAAIKSLDVSGNPKLDELSIENCHDITKLNVQKNTKLTSLTCRNGKLTNLNVTKNTKLGYLDCSQNKLTKLNVTKNTKLGYLYCSENKLTNHQ